MLVGALSSIAVFVAVTSLVLWVARLRGTPVEARLQRLGPAPGAKPLEAPFSDRIVEPILDGLSRLATQLLPQAFVTRADRQLVAAGRPMTTRAFFATVFLLSAFFPGSAFALVLLTGVADATSLLVFLALAGAMIGFMLPFLWLSRRVRARKLAIWKSLPDAFDLITVSVEAGLGLDAALRQVAEKLTGPLAAEIAHTLREVGMGRPRREALQELADRADVPELVTFVNAVIQAEQLGTSLGRTLRAQAQGLRLRRRQRAEQRARQAPVKMVFPLVLCIMPSFFLIVLGPILIRLFNYLSE